MDKLNLFVPITKVDAANRLVYGLATAETPDVAKEVCDYASTKPLYQAWSDNFAKVTDGKSLGNLRAMHGKTAAGKLTAIVFNDDAKQIEICAKVVDDAEWNKVEEGVYTGFSQGGRYVKRWKDGEMTKYTAEPLEVSLVDIPCLPSATFEVIKADGSTELRKFKAVEAAPPAISNEAVAAKATELAKAAGDEAKWAEHIAAARTELEKAATPPAPLVEPKPGDEAAKAAGAEGDDVWEQVWQSKRDGKTFKKKADLIAHHAALDEAAAAKPPVNPLLDKIAEMNRELDKRDPAKKGEAAFAIVKAIAAELAKAATAVDKAGVLRKGLYDVARLANLLSELSWLYDSVKWEAITEGDGSTVPASLQAALASLCGVLRALVIEETAELVEGVDIEVFEMAAGLVPHGHVDALVKLTTADAAVLTKDAKAAAPLAKFAEPMHKIGARHSKADVMRIDTMHKLSVELGATCAAEKAATGEELTKVAGDLARVTAERDEMKKQIGETMPKFDEMLARIKNIEAQPAAGGPARSQPVFKTQDGQPITSPTTEGLAEQIAKLPAEEAMTLMIKAAQQRGQTTQGFGR